MRVRVRFRYNTETGEVEMFVVEDIGGAAVVRADHDAIHDAITAEVAQVVERNAVIEEVQWSAAPQPRQAVRPDAPVEVPPEPVAPQVQPLDD